MILLVYLYKALKEIDQKITFSYSWLVSYLKFKLNRVLFSSDFTAMGVPIVNVNLSGTFVIGKNFSFHSGKYYNMIGRQQPCYFIVQKGGRLVIGDNVGMSCAALVCANNITIGDDVQIGGGVVIYDTDFHSLDVVERTSIPEIVGNVSTSPVEVKKGAFIGAHSIILKGVTIGENSIVGAGSVVTKSVPDNQIWAGNPAKFIRNL